MSPSARPEPTPFDPDTGTLPPAVDTLFRDPERRLPAILLVAGQDARGRGWASRAAVTLAATLGDEGQRVVLADLGVDAPELHQAVGMENEEGIADVFLFGASLRRVARIVPGHHFYFAPVGAYVPEAATLLGHGRWDRLIEGFAEAEALLVLYVPAELPGVDALARRVGHAVLLASGEEAADVAATLPPGCAVDAVLGPPEPAGSAAGGHPEEAPDEEELIRELATIQRQSKRRRWVSVLVGGAVVGMLAVGGWLAVQHYRSGAPRETEAPPSEEAAGTAVVEPPRPVESALPLSVVIESHQDYETARARAAALEEEEPEVEFYIAPVLVDGIVYYRLLAGPAADSATAWALMRRLVDAGHKQAVQAWAVRNTAWAYHIGEFNTPAAAEARRRELAGQGIPTYVVEVPFTAGPPRYRLYAGAYEGPAEAEVMARLLREAGVNAPLIRRIGRSTR